jgi:PPM family protein phosphatase
LECKGRDRNLSLSLHYPKRQKLTKYLPDVESSGLSVTGLVREDNQDTIHLHDPKLAPERGLLFAVADGMGGYSLGGIASKIALDSVSNALFSREIPNPSAIKTGIDAANLQVYNTALKKGVGRMGTTITAAYVLGNTLHLGHVGDSRAYLIRKGQATCLTVDHTEVGDLVRAKILSPNKTRTHANRSILTRAVGIGLFVKPDLSKHKLQEGDRIVLCSDGVWTVIEDNEFGMVASDLPIAKISQELVELALQRNTDDNASVVAFQITKFNSAVQSGLINRTDWLYKLRKITR